MPLEQAGVWVAANSEDVESAGLRSAYGSALVGDREKLHGRLAEYCRGMLQLKRRAGS